jgi:hypothetical protein
MNRFEVFQLRRVFRPKFHEQRNTEDNIAVTEYQYTDWSQKVRRNLRFTSLLQQTPHRQDLELGGLVGRSV